MKISYTHPATQNRTSITINNQTIRLWALLNNIQSQDDFMYDDQAMDLLKNEIIEAQKHYLKGTNNFPTFISYFENIVLIDVEMKLRSFNKKNAKEF